MVPTLALCKVDGSIDKTFGVNEKVATDFTGGSNWANALIIQADGKLVMAGRADNDFALARYNNPSIKGNLLFQNLRAKYYPGS